MILKLELVTSSGKLLFFFFFNFFLSNDNSLVYQNDLFIELASLFLNLNFCHGGGGGGPCMCRATYIEITGQFCGVGALLFPLCGCWGRNSAWQVFRANTFTQWALLPAPNWLHEELFYIFRLWLGFEKTGFPQRITQDVYDLAILYTMAMVWPSVLVNIDEYQLLQHLLLPVYVENTSHQWVGFLKKKRKKILHLTSQIPFFLTQWLGWNVDWKIVTLPGEMAGR